MESTLPAHSLEFRMRRAANWLPMGLAYAFLYMGRYNLTVAKGALGDLLTSKDFGIIFGAGAVVYGISFLFNGPFIDRVGGRRGMLIGTMGALIANVLMGIVLLGRVRWGWDVRILYAFVALYGLNMYFQSFGAVAIVTVKAPWFHVRERGTFSTIFGILIAAGIYFAFDWGTAVVDATRAAPKKLGLVATALSTIFGLGGSGVNEDWMIFFVPAVFLGIFWILMFLWLRDTPSSAGFRDFDTAEASLSDDGARLPAGTALRRIAAHPVLLSVCVIELCSGVLRNGVQNWYYVFSKEVGFQKSFWVTENWGLSLLLCGIVGANATGWVSDRFFGSRRGPTTAGCYALMIVGTLLMAFSLDGHRWIAAAGALAALTSVIAVHGILSGTATADFGGTRNTGIVVGIVDGCVYLGTAIQSVVIGFLAPTGEAAKDPANWKVWPMVLVPFAILGVFFAVRIWDALPSKARDRKEEPAREEEPVSA